MFYSGTHRHFETVLRRIRRNSGVRRRRRRRYWRHSCLARWSSSSGFWSLL